VATQTSAVGPTDKGITPRFNVISGCRVYTIETVIIMKCTCGDPAPLQGGTELNTLINVEI